ncbi:ABC transporter ATP-binding protein [Phormidium tenue]|uniref:ABC transporter ATP-binding protein n=1 Tax=Phormidium tenue NIES-30 TaxID=549789 RepID=A0A1U7J5A2_9CYAN|nr:ABC transporter ATP-binding protein [Phormidium tenue]MBD2232647.1 ABC transporter ATP-binding protein [Phormidium tenue FACHB-1052]OKH47777.1 ABC transporter ATP-binding protein [Phormidium tenue NIES-30]
MSDTILDVKHLTVHFEVDGQLIQAVNDISFQVQRGQTLGIVGESGSGKSVTSLAVMGLVPNPPGKVVNGEIWFNSGHGTPTDLATLSEAQLQAYRGGQVSMIFQEPMSSLNPVYTVGFQMVEAIRQHQNISKEAARQQAIARLQEVKLLPADAVLATTIKTEQPRLDDESLKEEVDRRQQAILDRYPHELSGGQIQRVMIAMAISCNPALLIADEPTTALDVTVQATILDLLRELRDRRGMSLIFITHDLGIIAEIADQVAVMYQGKIVEAGPVWDIFAQPQHPYTKGLLACRPQPTQRLRLLPTVADFMSVELAGTEINAAAANGGQPLAGAAPILRERVLDAEAQARFAPLTEEELTARAAALAANGPLLAVENLQVGYPVRGIFGKTRSHMMAVQDVSFQIQKGETFGLVGESGCGKTTLGRALLRLVPTMGGKIWFEGRDVLALGSSPLRQLRRDMQIVFQDPYSSLDPRMSIGAAIAEPLKIHGVIKSRRNQQERVAYLLDRVGLPASAMNRYPHEFSGGQRQRVCIARALALNPKFIICDESVSALDVSVQAQVLNLLKELQAEFDLTYIFISHDLAVVKFMSDRIMVMNQGRVEEIGPAEQVYRQPQTPYTQALINAIPVGSLDRIQELQRDRASVA